MNWEKFALKLPMVVGGIFNIVNKVQGAQDGQKTQAVLDAVPESVSLLEFAVEKDLLNDDAIKALLAEVVQAEGVLARARAALKQGILTHPATATDASRVH